MIKTHTATVKKRKESRSDIASSINTWEYMGKINGFMDFLIVAKGEVAQKIIEDSTHIFICETKLDIEQGDRLFIKDIGYEVNFVDRPMYGKQAEIELKPIKQNNNSSEAFIYFGVSNETMIIESDVLGFENQVFKNKSFTEVIDVMSGNLFIVYPKSFSKSSIRLNNKPITDWEINEIMVNGVLHYAYSVAVVEGTLNIELF